MRKAKKNLKVIKTTKWFARKKEGFQTKRTGKQKAKNSHQSFRHRT